MKDQKLITYIDPPSGWLYGFPRPIPEDYYHMTKEQVDQWFVDNGYPKKELDKWVDEGMPCGFFEA